MYTADSHITNLDEVKAFFSHVVSLIGDEWHPDDKYSFYLDVKTKEPVLTTDQQALYDRLQAECFAVCEAADEDIYDLGWEVIEKKMKLECKNISVCINKLKTANIKKGVLLTDYISTSYKERLFFVQEPPFLASKTIVSCA